MTDRLGVVIPTHNRVAMLERALDSVPPGVEVVVVDDASTDFTPNLLAARADRVCHVRLDRNRGPGVARNVGIQHSSARYLLFLDDDDFLLPEATARIRAVIETHPDVPLHLHNCVWSTGETSIPPSTPVTPVDYGEWLRGRFMSELKPVARRDIFDSYAYEDTGASGEGLLWGRVIRDHGAIASGPPIVMYNIRHHDRLTSTRGLLHRADSNAGIALRWLELFGTDQRDFAPRQYRTRVLAAAMYSVLAGRRTNLRTLSRMGGLHHTDRLVIWALSVVPSTIVAMGFRVQRVVKLAHLRRNRSPSGP